MTDVPSRQEYRYRPGGLFRCCTQTLDDLAQEGKLVMNQGHQVTCLYCKKTTMVFSDGQYQWVGPEAEKARADKKE